MAKGRILAIDDEKFFRQLFRDLLGAEGYYVKTVTSGEEALTALQREEFDLVITDMEMAGMDGLGVTEAIKRYDPELEVVIVTAQHDVPKAVEAMKRGVSEYLLKPINSEEFLLVINKILFRQSLRQENSKLLHENLEFFSMLASYRKCLDFLNVQDLDRFGDLVLDTLMEMLRCEGGALWLTGYGGRSYRLRCQRGLAQIFSDEEVFQPGNEERALLAKGEPVFIQSGSALWIPLQSDMEPYGLIRMEAPLAREKFNRTDLKVAGGVAEFAVSSLAHLLRYRQLERNCLRVPRGKAYHMAFFRDYVERELLKARRYGRNLSLVKLVIDNYQQLSHLFLDKELEVAVEDLVNTINSALRDADVLAMDNPSEFYILLPETDYWGSLVTQERIRKALRGKLNICDMRRSYPIGISLRSASCPVDGSTFSELVGVCHDRLHRLKDSLLLAGDMEDASYWSVVARLLGKVEDYTLDDDRGLTISSALKGFEATGKSRYFRMPIERIDDILASFCHEVVESSRVRGVIYRGCSDFDRIRRTLPDIEGLERSATYMYLLGGKKRAQWDYHRVIPIYLEEGYFQKTVFLLYLNEDYAYALFGRRMGKELIGFHTSDFYFVEHMISKLQIQYQLQRQI